MNYLPGLLSDELLKRKERPVEPVLLADAGLLSTEHPTIQLKKVIKSIDEQAINHPSNQAVEQATISQSTVDGWKDYAKNLEDAKARWELANSARVKFETDVARFESKKRANPYLPDFVLHNSVAPRPVPLTPAQIYILRNPPPNVDALPTKLR